MGNIDNITKEYISKYRSFLPEDFSAVKLDENVTVIQLEAKKVILKFREINSDANTLKEDLKNVETEITLAPDMFKVGDLGINLPINYRLNKDQPVVIENGKVTVNVEKTKDIKVNYKLNGKIQDIDGAQTVLTIADNSTIKNIKTSDITLPSGYEFESKDNIPFDQDGKSITVSIKKSNKTNGSSNHTVNNNQNHSSNQTTPTNKVITKDFKGTVATNPGQYVTLYNAEGKAIAGRRLAGDSNWAADKTMVRDGVKYYRVATNEWVKASDVYEYTVSNAVVETAAGNYKKLFDSKGNIISNRGLAAGTKWMTDKVALIQGEKMYRVATNEWLKAVDVK